MKFKLPLVLLAIFAFSSGLFAASSTSYSITTQVIDSGGVKGTSTSYQVLGKSRDKGLSTPSSSSFIIGEGFLRTAYYGPVVFAPIVTSIDPTAAPNSKSLALTVNGANFTAGATVKISLAGEKDITATNVSVISSAKVTCDLNIVGAKTGLWTVTVTNSDGRSGSLPSALTITSAAPTVTAITPSSGNNNATVEISYLAGDNFKSGATVKLTKTGENDIVATNVSVVSAAKITCRFDLNGRTTGRWDVIVTNEDGQSGTLAGGFKIEAQELAVTKPIVSEQNPFNPTAGATALKYSLSKDAEVTVSIFSIRGERVWVQRLTAGIEGGKVGENSIPWDGLSGFREYAPSGVYFVRLTAVVDGQIKTLSTTKIALVRQ